MTKQGSKLTFSVFFVRMTFATVSICLAFSINDDSATSVVEKTLTVVICPFSCSNCKRNFESFLPEDAEDAVEDTVEVLDGEVS